MPFFCEVVTIFLRSHHHREFLNLYCGTTKAHISPQKSQAAQAWDVIYKLMYESLTRFLKLHESVENKEIKMTTLIVVVFFCILGVSGTFQAIYEFWPLLFCNMGFLYATDSLPRPNGRLLSSASWQSTCHSGHKYGGKFFDDPQRSGSDRLRPEEAAQLWHQKKSERSTSQLVLQGFPGPTQRSVPLLTVLL